MLSKAAFPGLSTSASLIIFIGIAAWFLSPAVLRAGPAHPDGKTEFTPDDKKTAAPLEADNVAQWPEVWGELGNAFYATGSRTAPNGISFNPVFSTDLSLNIGLLPGKRLYLFTEDRFWAQRASAAVTNANQGSFDFSKREVDLHFGLAWNVFDTFELRASGYSLNNLNRGTSPNLPSGYKDGAAVEGRYYFGKADPYDVGRLNFAGVGYGPTDSLVGGNSDSFEPGLFARAYLTYELPRLRSYLFWDGQLSAERGAMPRLLTMDTGVAMRPFGITHNLEVRLGDDVTADFRSGSTDSLVYLEFRLDYQADLARQLDGAIPAANSSRWPEVWGALGSEVYMTGSRMAPNGIPYRPVMSADLDLNVGLLSNRQLYLFTQDTFWAQRSSPSGTNSSGGGPRFSKREVDLDAGLALRVYDRFEARASAYALNNLDRGISTGVSKGYQDGAQVEGRYYLPSANDYDVDKLNFASLGYYPTKSLIGADGLSFKPGFYARAYLTREIPRLRSFLYADAQLTCERAGTLKLVTVDMGIATRPFAQFENLELRGGDDLTLDPGGRQRNLLYLGARILFGK